MQAFSRN